VILRGRLVADADPRTVTPEELGSAMTGADLPTGAPGPAESDGVGRESPPEQRGPGLTGTGTTGAGSLAADPDAAGRDGEGEA
jgi:hypothetical protein